MNSIKNKVNPRITSKCIDIRSNISSDIEDVVEVIIQSEFEEKFYQAKVNSLEIRNKFLNRLANLFLFGLLLCMLFIFFNPSGLQSWI
jgi:hypothetical protein